MEIAVFVGAMQSKAMDYAVVRAAHQNGAELSSSGFGPHEHVLQRFRFDLNLNLNLKPADAVCLMAPLSNGIV